METSGAARPRTDPYTMEFHRKSWRPSATASWNQIPAQLRTEPKLSRFKSQLKTWVPAAIPPKVEL